MLKNKLLRDREVESIIDADECDGDVTALREAGLRSEGVELRPETITGESRQSSELLPGRKEISLER